MWFVTMFLYHVKRDVNIHAFCELHGLSCMMVKVKPNGELRRGALLPYMGLEPVTHGQCVARPTVTFPASEHHCPLTGIKLYCLVTEAQLGTQRCK